MKGRIVEDQIENEINNDQMKEDLKEFENMEKSLLLKFFVSMKKLQVVSKQYTMKLQESQTEGIKKRKSQHVMQKK